MSQYLNDDFCQNKKKMMNSISVIRIGGASSAYVIIQKPPTKHVVSFRSAILPSSPSLML